MPAWLPAGYPTVEKENLYTAVACARSFQLQLAALHPAMSCCSLGTCIRCPTRRLCGPTLCPANLSPDSEQANSELSLQARACCTSVKSYPAETSASCEKLLMLLSGSSFQEHHRPKMHLQKLLAIKLGNMPCNNFALTGAMQATWVP